MNRSTGLIIGLTLFGCYALSGCGGDQNLASESTAPVGQSVSPETVYGEIEQRFYQSQPVWALNLGGPEYVDLAGTAYEADSQYSLNAEDRIEQILGAQDPTVYTTYRLGDILLEKTLDAGLYDIRFLFAEPEDLPVGDRVFNIQVEGQPVISELDVKRSRESQYRSALVISVADIEVSDGQLDIVFQSVAGEPLLNAVVVHKRVADTRPWVLSWSDEFDYQGAPDPDKWNIEVWSAGRVNNEDQAYTARDQNVRVEEGVLVLEAFKEDYEGAHYTSGRIQSAGKGDILYGRVEIRARLPRGQGTWPALWMMPTNPFRYASNCSTYEEWESLPDCDAWPNSGEIDIVEHVGYEMNRVHGTVHNRAYYWVNSQQRKGAIDARDVSDEFHTYSLEWTPERLDIYADGTHYFTYLNDGQGWQSWPYDHPFHVILNLAIGGNWGRAGGPIDDSIFPVRLEVDYVRFFQLDDRQTSEN